MKNIFYIGWGSLLWDTKFLKIKDERWERTQLELPIEDSRISDKGRGRLTLVIDEKNGTLNKMWKIKANTKNLNIAIRRLMKREKTTIGKICYYNAINGNGRFNKYSEPLVTKIKDWCKSEGIDALIWTGLENNWERFRDVPYTTKDALKYFEGSYATVQTEILNYIYQSFKLGQISTKFTHALLKKISNQTSP